MFYLSYFFSIVGVLLGVAFFTLVERKIMGLMHYRKGPNKVIILGLSQPISDATKLLTKENFKISSMKIAMFWTGPLMSLLLMIICWSFYESMFSLFNNEMKVFSLLAVMSLMAFPFMLISWGSNSKYSILGGYRIISQIISYEVCLMIFIYSMIYMSKSYSLMKLMNLQENLWFMVLMLPFFFCWIIICMAESNRTPFDMAEGESEIVSGFNIEHGGGLFALIFITEYGMIMFLSFLTSSLFMGMNLLLLKTFFICYLYVWVRCCFPRLRYDKLMKMSWKILLPWSLCMLSLSLSVLIII